MNLPPFLLDHWLMAHAFASPPVRFDLAASTGPKWTLGALKALGGGIDLTDVKLSYAQPAGSEELRKALGDFLDVDPEWVVVTTGASEAMSILFCLAARPGADVLMPEPAFPAFDAMAGAWGLGVRHYALDRNNRHSHAADAILGAAGPQTALALVNTPHNPTGSVASRGAIAAIAAGLGEQGVPLVVDEVYHPLYFGASAASSASVGNVVAIGDMSKALSLAGLRIGWIVDANAERRRRLVDARSYFTISGSPLLERLATHAVMHREVLFGRLREVASRNLDALAAFMNDVQDILAWVRPEGGTVSFPWFRDGRDSRPFCEALAKAGVLVAPGDCFGRPDHMRVGFAAEADGFEEALAIFGRVLRDRP